MFQIRQGHAPAYAKLANPGPRDRGDAGLTASRLPAGPSPGVTASPEACIGAHVGRDDRRRGKAARPLPRPVVGASHGRGGRASVGWAGVAARSCRCQVGDGRKPVAAARPSSDPKERPKTRPRPGMTGRRKDDRNRRGIEPRRRRPAKPVRQCGACESDNCRWLGFQRISCSATPS